MVITNEQVGNDFLHQRLVNNIKATVPAKYVTYICSEMAATDTFVVHYTDAFSKYFYCKLFRHAGDINIMIIVNL